MTTVLSRNFSILWRGKKKRWQKNKGILWLGYHRYSSKKPVSTVSKCSLVLTSYLFWSQNFLNEIAPSPFLILLKLRCNFCTEFQYLCLELCIKLGCEEGTVHVHWFLFVFDILIEKFIFLSWVKWKSTCLLMSWYYIWNKNSWNNQNAMIFRHCLRRVCNCNFII